MSEGKGGGSKLSIGGLMSPGIGIIKSWQGIVEISLRGVLIVLAFITMIACGSCQSSVSNDVAGAVGPLSRNINSAAGWLIFMALIVFLYEIVWIVQRFLNISIINNHIKIALIIDSIVHGVLVLGLFAGAVALASYVPGAKDQTGIPTFGGTFRRIVSAAEAACVFAFFLLIVVVGTTVFIVLGALVFGWNPTLAKYTSSGGGGGGEGE